jgi:predicted nucleic acid-binding protein
MADVAIDSSVAAKWVLPESDTAEAQAILVAAAQSNSKLRVLDLAMAEVTNAIWVRWLRGLITAPEADGLLSDFLALPLTVVSSRSLLPEALRLSARYRISVYDSLFVAATVADSISGVTADEPLVHAVKTDFPQIHLLRSWSPSGP